MQSSDEIPPLVTEEMQSWDKYKTVDGGHICQWTGAKFGYAQLDHLGNIPDKYRKNLTSGLGEDAKMRNCLRTYERRIVPLYDKLYLR